MHIYNSNTNFWSSARKVTFWDQLPFCTTRICPGLWPILLSLSTIRDKHFLVVISIGVATNHLHTFQRVSVQRYIASYLGLVRTAQLNAYVSTSSACCDHKHAHTPVTERPSCQCMYADSDMPSDDVEDAAASGGKAGTKGRALSRILRRSQRLPLVPLRNHE